MHFTRWNYNVSLLIYFQCHYYWFVWNIAFIVLLTAEVHQKGKEIYSSCIHIIMQLFFEVYSLSIVEKLKKKRKINFFKPFGPYYIIHQISSFWRNTLFFLFPRANVRSKQKLRHTFLLKFKETAIRQDVIHTEPF